MSFHSVLLKNTLKRQHFGFTSMREGARLAVMVHNKIVGQKRGRDTEKQQQKQLWHNRLILLSADSHNTIQKHGSKNPRASFYWQEWSVKVNVQGEVYRGFCVIVYENDLKGAIHNNSYCIRTVLLRLFTAPPAHSLSWLISPLKRSFQCPPISLKNALVCL